MFGNTPIALQGFPERSLSMPQKLDQKKRACIFTQPIISLKDLVAPGLPPQVLEEIVAAPTTNKKGVRWTSDVPKTSELVAKQAPNPKKKKGKRKQSRFATAPTRMMTRAAAAAEAAAGAEAQGEVGKAPRERSASTNSKSRKVTTARAQKRCSMAKESPQPGNKNTSEPVAENTNVVTRTMVRRASKTEAQADPAKRPRSRKAAMAAESGIEKG